MQNDKKNNISNKYMKMYFIGLSMSSKYKGLVNIAMNYEEIPP